MNAAALSLGEYTDGQLRDLCKAVKSETEPDTPLELLRALLGPASDRPLSEPASWPSDVADDTTPIEFSIAFDDNGDRVIRILGETVAEKPSPTANMLAARRLLDFLADRFELSLDRLRTVEDLFLPDQPQGLFSLWFSFIFRPKSAPNIKVYFNPEVHGVQRAPGLVAEALRRLGLADAYRTVVDHALQRGSLDRFVFFALDLDQGPRSRVKLYVSHDSADSTDAENAAAAVAGADPAEIRDFCTLIGGGKGPFPGRPLISSYAFAENDSDRPSNYSLYLPIRDYVPDDEAARSRVLEFLRQRGADPSVLDEALAAMTQRPLHDRSGLIAHVSLRLGQVDSGTTIYLSSEAYGGTPLKQKSVPVAVA